MMQRVYSFSFVWLLGISLWLAGCTPETQLPQEQVLQGSTLGTTYSVKFFSDLPVDQQRLQQQMEQELELINDLMSTYRPTSELMRFNQQQTTEPFTLSEQTAKVIAEAIRIGLQTDGVLDITVGPLVEKWGFGANGRITERPAPEALNALQDFVGLDKISLSQQHLTKKDSRVALDLSTIAKGYGVDRLAEILVANHVTDYLVDIGGEMRVSGSKPGREWRVAI